MSAGNLAKKMVAAMASVDAVAKNGKHQRGYTYVQAVDVANAVREALINAGIAFSYKVISERHWTSETKAGAVQYCCSLHVVVTFHDSDSGETIEGGAIGWGVDDQDKAPYKAMTGALKYALRMNLLIPDDADPENDSPAAHGAQRSIPPPYSQPTQQSTAANQQVNRGTTISEAQSKRFFAMAKTGNKSNDDIKRYLMNVCHCEKSLDIAKADYERACAWAAAIPSPTTPDPSEITDDDIPF